MQSAGSQSKINKFNIEIKMRKMKREAAECDTIEKWQPDTVELRKIDSLSDWKESNFTRNYIQFSVASVNNIAEYLSHKLW